MKYVIDETVAKEMGLTIPELFALLLINTEENVGWTITRLIEKNAVIPIGNGTKIYRVAQQWKNKCDNLVLTCKKRVPEEDVITSIAEKLMSIFPKGKKPGTPYYWKANKREIIIRLKSFFELYGDTYKEEDILTATRNYVESFSGDYRFMRLLKYFIWKKEEDGVVSELASCIDNIGQDDVEEDSWTNQLI